MTDPDATRVALLRRAFAMRAAAYAHIFDVLREEQGDAAAVRLVSRAAERMGREMGKGLAHNGPGDLAGLRDDFLAGIIERDALFAPEVIGCDADALEIRFHRCPLKEAWQDAGRSDGDLQTLCRIAGAIDIGLFEAAGFTFAGSTWTPGQSGCCRLRVLPGPGAGDASA